MDRNDLVKYLYNTEYRIKARDLFDKLSEVYTFRLKHKPSIGNFGEHILLNFLKTILPDNVGVSQGFIQGKDGCLSPQCDIIIYKKSKATIVKSFGDIYIVSNEYVLSIIEVKTRIQRKTFESTLAAFNKLAQMGCCNNYIFIYNRISPRTLCSYLYPQNNNKDSFSIRTKGLYDHGDQYRLPVAICNLQSNYFLCQDYVINERDEYGYIAYQLKDDVDEISCLQMFIGTIINLFHLDNTDKNDDSGDIDFKDLSILYSHGLWQL